MTIQSTDPGRTYAGFTQQQVDDVLNDMGADADGDGHLLNEVEGSPEADVTGGSWKQNRGVVHSALDHEWQKQRYESHVNKANVDAGQGAKGEAGNRMRTALAMRVDELSGFDMAEKLRIGEVGKQTQDTANKVTVVPERPPGMNTHDYLNLVADANPNSGFREQMEAQRNAAFHGTPPFGYGLDASIETDDMRYGRAGAYNEDLVAKLGSPRNPAAQDAQRTTLLSGLAATARNVPPRPAGMDDHNYLEMIAAANPGSGFREALDANRAQAFHGEKPYANGPNPAETDAQRFGRAGTFNFDLIAKIGPPRGGEQMVAARTAVIDGVAAKVTVVPERPAGMNDHDYLNEIAKANPDSGFKEAMEAARFQSFLGAEPFGFNIADKEPDPVKFGRAGTYNFDLIQKIGAPRNGAPAQPPATQTTPTTTTTTTTATTTVATDPTTTATPATVTTAASTTPAAGAAKMPTAAEVMSAYPALAPIVQFMIQMGLMPADGTQTASTATTVASTTAAATPATTPAATPAAPAVAPSTSSASQQEALKNDWNSVKQDDWYVEDFDAFETGKNAQAAGQDPRAAAEKFYEDKFNDYWSKQSRPPTAGEREWFMNDRLAKFDKAMNVGSTKTA